jgi:carbamoyltransferase
MFVLGLSGGFAVHDNADVPRDRMHDAAAVLLHDGRIVAAIEEERLNRIKHTNKAPVQAIRFCLERAGITLADVERLCWSFSEEALNIDLAQVYRYRPWDYRDVRAEIQDLLAAELGYRVARERISFVHHHIAHAYSAFSLSGFERSLVVTFDGVGDHTAGLVLAGAGTGLEIVHAFPAEKSLGQFYEIGISPLGYHLFDEYKAMGLAPYGDPARFQDLFRQCYELLPDGQYALDLPRLILTLSQTFKARRRGEPFEQIHKDLAAALQGALEELIFHVLRHYRHDTGLTSLCLAGGVAHNCTANGRILDAGLFERVFVQPASHDAGCAIGAAVHGYFDAAEQPRALAAITDVYWGPAPDLGQARALLARWRDHVAVEEAHDIADRAAQSLAEGCVIGWVQGRSEFGPRALGNRSILADPRPAENKHIVNQMVKKRESYRPFAPAVLEEQAAEYFELAPGVAMLDFMSYAVRVRPDKRALLGAITHVDGSARLQTVRRQANPAFWQLIDRFRARTGVPIVLNTSFNNDVEPIVDSVEDALVCFLTTGLHHLIIGNLFISKKDADMAAYLSLVPELPPHVYLSHTRSSRARRFTLRHDHDSDLRYELDEALAWMFDTLDGRASLGELAERCPFRIEREVLVQRMRDAWSRRLVRLTPGA